jgi:hypothetical protein
VTPEQFKERMARIEAEHGNDPHKSHKLADDLTCELLTKLGYGEGVAVFEEMDKWYA